MARAEGVSHPHIDAHADANADVNADADSDFDAERDRLDWLENQPPATSAQRVHRATFLLTITVAALALCVVVVAVVWRLLR